MKRSLQSRLAEACAQAASSSAAAGRLQQHLLAALLCPERLTLTNIICTNGGQHLDWSADYRLYSKGRVDCARLFDSVRGAVDAHLPAGAPLVVAVDDTLVRKSGTNIAGVTWKRDPLGPAFSTNFVRGQRYLQFSVAWPLGGGAARLVPIAFHHAPSAQKLPPKLRDDAAAQTAHRAERKLHSLTAQTLGYLWDLRERTPRERAIHLAGDGGYTNATILKGLPEGVTYIGRMRKDAVLHYPPERKAEGSKGRSLSYGALAPTPDALRADEQTPWQEVSAYASGKTHRFKIKTMSPVMWRKAGANKLLRVIVIAPIGYRLRKGSKLLYRQPAYILCSDPDLPIEQVLQSYLWRWGIEVNFREEKSLIGTGQAQVRGEASNEQIPGMTVAAYAHLWVAALSLHSSDNPLTTLRPPKWRPRPEQEGPPLPSTGELLRLLRYEYWAPALRPATFYHFATGTTPATSAEKCTPDLAAALLSAA